MSNRGVRTDGSDVFIGAWFHRWASRAVVRFGTDGVEWKGVVTPWALEPDGEGVHLVRAVLLPKQGFALACATRFDLVLLTPTISSSRARLVLIRDACTPLVLRHPGVFDFEILDDSAKGRVLFEKYSMQATSDLARGLPLPPPPRPTSRWAAAAMVVGVVLAVAIGVIAQHRNGDGDGATPPRGPACLSPQWAPAKATWNWSRPVETVTMEVDGAQVWQAVASPSKAASFTDERTLEGLLATGGYTESGVRPSSVATGSEVSLTVSSAGAVSQVICA